MIFRWLYNKLLSDESFAIPGDLMNRNPDDRFNWQAQSMQSHGMNAAAMQAESPYAELGRLRSEVYHQRRVNEELCATINELIDEYDRTTAPHSQRSLNGFFETLENLRRMARRDAPLKPWRCAGCGSTESPHATTVPHHLTCIWSQL